MKSIDFLEKQAIAVYFYDMTHHVESLKQETEVLEQKSTLQDRYQTSMSQEFRMPLTTILMFLESLLGANLGA